MDRIKGSVVFVYELKRKWGVDFSGMRRIMKTSDCVILGASITMTLIVRHWTLILLLQFKYRDSFPTTSIVIEDCKYFRTRGKRTWKVFSIVVKSRGPHAF